MKRLEEAVGRPRDDRLWNEIGRGVLFARGVFQRTDDSIRRSIKSCPVLREKGRREGGREGGHGNWAKRTYAEFRRLMEIYYGYSLCSTHTCSLPVLFSLTHTPSSTGGCSCARKRLSRWPLMAKFHFCPMIPLLREEFLRDNRTGGRITRRRR